MPDIHAKIDRLSPEEANLYKIRHSTQHLLTKAMINLFGKKKIIMAMGPATEDGFYFDYDSPKGFSVSQDDFPAIESEMQRLVDLDLPITREQIDPEDARKLFADNPYKQDWITIAEEKREPATVYWIGKETKDEFVDFCAGPHAASTGEIGAFKLLSIAGAYWHGDENNKMLTRIYGTAFKKAKELRKFLNNLEEAKKRDHKKIGPQLELFMFHETSPGMPYWLPKGVTIYNQLISFWREEHQKRGYQEIISPLLNKKELYITSGHYDHYWDQMFVVNTKDEGEYAMKAMNCPNSHIVFGSKTRSYKDLPLRLSDTDALHRYERSGTLNGLFRVREFRQDDAHIYVTEDQIESEYKEVFEITKRFYSIFGMQYSFRLGTRDEGNFMGDVKTWDKAENTLKKILSESGIEYFVLDGDGAFYGPKVDILMKDALGRSWQMGTIQLDFQQPKRFNLQYTAADGSLKTPVAIHRVIYGSLERFMGILIEHFAGAFPLWLSPVQIAILPISDKVADYAKEVAGELKGSGLRIELDDSAESLGKKIHNAAKQKTPLTVIVGEKEKQASTISVRQRGGKDLGSMTVTELLTATKEKIEDRSLDLL